MFVYHVMKIKILEVKVERFKKENEDYRIIVNRPPQIKEVVENVIIRKTVIPTTTTPREYINFRPKPPLPVNNKVKYSH